MIEVQASNPNEKDMTPKPTFDVVPLGADVRKALDKLGYVHPTPVQLAVFEPAVRGKSLVVQARTGTGKTTAFGMPIIDSLVKKSVPHVQALILTPTRELAVQVAKELAQVALFRGTKVVPIYGGAPMGRQIEALAEGAQIVCGTPGRVLDHLRRGTLDPSHIRIFVLDEADEMLSMGFAKELHAIIEMLPTERQGLYFSATIPPDVERLATSHLRNPEYLTLSSDQVGAVSISHFVYLIREGDKRASLLRIIEVEDPESAVIFCNTKDETERVAEALKRSGYDADWLNGDLEQRERERIMGNTKEGKLRFLVATDVAARGIDISHLTHVINADFPDSAEQYVHRTGRTGRAGRTGTAISIVGPKDVGHLYMLRLTYNIRPVERTLPTKGELRTREETDLVAFLADAYAAKAADPIHLAVARRLLTHEMAETIVAGLLQDHLGSTAMAGSDDDVAAQAAAARRAKNPPVDPAQDESPHTLREGPVFEPRAESDGAQSDGAESSDCESWRDHQQGNVHDEITRPRLPEGPPTPRDPRESQSKRGDRNTRNTRQQPRPLGVGRHALPPTPGYRIEPDDMGEVANIFVNVGRRDGLEPIDIQNMLNEGGVLGFDLRNVRIRDRISFVTVPRADLDRAIRALVGRLIGGRTINAELAREQARS
ncbi:MAG: DEAD/DEAH box helicase [Polyangiaceae bacterium]|nr:DEAD/DEAH box helicase [Polyangiaceae bacterium]